MSSPSDAIAFFRRKLRPAAAVPDETIERLIDELDDDRFLVRDGAMRHLEKLGELADCSLLARLEAKPSLEGRRRIQQLLRSHSFPITRGVMLRPIRALEALEKIGTADARTIIEKLALGAPAARVTCEARQAVGRMRSRNLHEKQSTATFNSESFTLFLNKCP